MTRIPHSVRRALRATQLALGAWLTLLLLHVLLAPPAAADNCAVFTDCFGVANSAVEAAFGLSLLAVISLVLDFVPFVGTGKGLIEAGTGRDLITGEQLAPWERALGVLPLVGGLTALKYADDLAGVGRHADDLGAGGRHVDDFGAGGRHVDDLGGGGRYFDEVPSRTWDEGTGRALDPSNRSLVDDYVQGTTAQRRLLAEQIGERGALQYLRETTGRDIDIFRPGADAQVTDLRGLMDAGKPWPHAVAFRGSRATNLVYFDGQKMIVIEAKGGGSGYGDRVATVVIDTKRADGRIAQTHPRYPFDVAQDMRISKRADGRGEVGQLIQRAYRRDAVEYVGVRTGGYADLSAGTPRVVLEHVFRSPGGQP